MEPLVTIDPKDPDYTLRWPPELFAEEVRHLVVAARSGTLDDEWEEEVATLLRQAFDGSEPLEAFCRQMTTPTTRMREYDDEEPF